jgi:hypothetical protein
MARDFAYDMLNSVEPHGVLITAGDNDTFPLVRAGGRRHPSRRDLANPSLMNTEWHLRQLPGGRRRLDPSRADPVWRGVLCPPPTTPKVLKLENG